MYPSVDKQIRQTEVEGGPKGTNCNIPASQQMGLEGSTFPVDLTQITADAFPSAYRKNANLGGISATQDEFAATDASTALNGQVVDDTNPDGGLGGGVAYGGWDAMDVDAVINATDANDVQVPGDISSWQGSKNADERLDAVSDGELNATATVQTASMVRKVCSTSRLGFPAHSFQTISMTCAEEIQIKKA